MINNVKESKNNIIPFVELSCNGKLQYKSGRLYKCDFIRYFYIEGLNLDKFECPICKSKSCSIRTIEKIVPFWVLKLKFLCRKIQKIRIRSKPENKKKISEWVKDYKSKMKSTTEQLINKGLSSREINFELKMVQEEFMNKLDKIHQEMYANIK